MQGLLSDDEDLKGNPIFYREPAKRSEQEYISMQYEIRTSFACFKTEFKEFNIYILTNLLVEFNMEGAIRMNVSQKYILDRSLSTFSPSCFLPFHLSVLKNQTQSSMVCRALECNVYTISNRKIPPLNREPCWMYCDTAPVSDIPYLLLTIRAECVLFCRAAHE